MRFRLNAILNIAAYFSWFGIPGAGCLVATTAKAGEVTGAVVDETGKPVAGAHVLISHTPSVKLAVTEWKAVFDEIAIQKPVFSDHAEEVRLLHHDFVHQRGRVDDHHTPCFRSCSESDLERNEERTTWR